MNSQPTTKIRNIFLILLAIFFILSIIYNTYMKRNFILTIEKEVTNAEIILKTENKKLKEDNEILEKKIEEMKLKSPVTLKNKLPENKETNLKKESLETYWNNFGKNKYEESCDYDFGFSLIKRWRKTKKNICLGKGKESTNVYCNNIKQTRFYFSHNYRHTGEDNFCYFDNLYLQGTQFIGKCTQNGWVGPFQLEMSSYMNSFKSDLNVKCQNKYPGTTLLVHREGVFNVFHMLSGFINTFISLLILDQKPKIDRVI
jgi:cell division protein FtsB